MRIFALPSAEPIPLLLAVLALIAPAAAAATARCALCDKPILAGRETFLDFENGRREVYRCVHCALTAQAAAGERSTIRTRSPLSGTEIRIDYDGGAWRVTPPGAVFLSLPETAGECADRHLAFTGRDEFRRYLERHPQLARGEVRAYTIGELADLLAAGLPASGERPDAPVQLLVVGMTTHLPFKESVLPAIERALAAAGPQAGVRFVDATRPEGRAILAARGIHEHLPVVMFLDGESRFELGGRTVELRGFPGSSWTGDDLAQLLRDAVQRHRGRDQGDRSSSRTSGSPG